LSADGAKIALWKVYNAGYKMTCFIHDEIIVELLEDENLQEHVQNIIDLMVEGMVNAIPDVTIKAEPAMMRRWYKEAEAVYDENEHLVAWTPEGVSC